MTVHCPHCSTGYLLPDHLMGPRGARVRCPHCQRPFVVLRESEGAAITRPEPAAEVFQGVALEREVPELPLPEAPRAAPRPEQEFIMLAAELLDELAGQLGQGLAQAKAGGRILADFGPEIMHTYERYRERSGGRAGSAPFRAALKERWGVDLTL